MADLPSYPPIEPTFFDLIVLGTGLPESIIAAAASAASKTVLQLDPNPFYGSNFTSLSPSELSAFISSHSQSASPSSDAAGVLDLVSRPLYSSLEISNFSPDQVESDSRKIFLDVAGPKVFFCADSSIDLMLKSEANQYLEFKSIDASFIGDGSGKFLNVPDSRAAIFKDKSLGLMEKNQLMRFLKRVQGHVAAEEEAKISEEDLDSPFVEFLNKMGLPAKIKSIILYAIVMADYDQDDIIACEDLLKTRDGIERLALYNASVGRFQNAFGALIYPMYGQGELTQAYCRRAAVKGCIHVLRMPVTSVLVDEDSRCLRGVRLASGQDISCSKLILDPCYVAPFQLASPPSSHPVKDNIKLSSHCDDKAKVARGICITGSSLKANISNLLVVYPPRSLFPEQVTSIRVLQIGGNLGVCPQGLFIVYISALCGGVTEGKNLLHSAMSALLLFPSFGDTETAAQSEKAESSSDVPNGNYGFHNRNEERKPTILWCASYIQELMLCQPGSICSTPMPDGSLHYNVLLNETVKLFHDLYPGEEFFPETPSTEKSEEDGGLGVEN